MNNRKPIGLTDMNGQMIFTGDIVEFYFCADKGHSKEPSTEYTRMRDLVVEKDGEYYFACGIGAAYASMHNDFCRIIGTDKLLIDT